MTLFSSSSRRPALLVFVVMAVLAVVLTVLVLHFAASSSSSAGPSYSRAEPVVDRTTKTTLAFPFEKELWMSGSSLAECRRGSFRCRRGNGTCLGLERRCDGRVDCPEAEDEVNCVCAFRMPAAKFCDKYPDCFDESDEAYCSYCPGGAFNCGDGKCVPTDRVCDARADCDNFADESSCFRLSSTAAVDLPAQPSLRAGFLLRNREGSWHPMCADPHDRMQGALASFACVSITSDPLAASTHQRRKFGRMPRGQQYIYHYMGRFVQWGVCVSGSGLFVSCADARCGLNPHHLAPRGRIVGGEASRAGAWPWHAAVYKNGTYACGATLVGDRWLVSAAHCFLNHRFNYYEVQLGMLRRRSFTPHQKTLSVDRVVPHPHFNIVTLEYDLVLLRTAVPVPFDHWTRPICLPSGTDTRRTEATGSACTAIGWGDTGELEEDSDSLQEVSVPLTASCKRDPDRWLCAGYAEGGRDACQGDSGGPLMCPRGDGLSWYIAGVISAGTGCARPKTPGMYTRVAYFMDWIQRVMDSDHRVVRRRMDGSATKRNQGSASRRLDGSLHGSASWRLDGSASRKFGLDEEVRPLESCPGLKCAALGGGNCLRLERVCDGNVDCYDARDEVNCAGRRKV